MDPKAGRTDFRKIVEDLDQLPALPSIVAQLSKVITSADSSAEDAARLIERDTALTSKMLRIANSSFYGMPRTVASVSSAVVILGFNTIRSLVVGASLMKMFGSLQSAAIDQRAFWMHSIICAMASRIIAQESKAVRLVDPESAFCAGLMHDVGKLILGVTVPEAYANVCTLARLKNLPLVSAEQELLGIDHAGLGRIVSDKWALPPELEHSIVYHHAPQNSDKLTELVSVIHLSDLLAHRQNATVLAGEAAPPVCEEARRILRLNDADDARINGALEHEKTKSSDFFAIMSG